jgi:origin recognition complex subunit 5
VPQRLLGPKPFPLDRLLALFAALYAEHAERPPDLQPFPDDYESDDSMDGESPLDTNGNRGGSWLVSAEERKRRDDKRKARDNEVEERWEDEVWHLTMSVKLWGMVRPRSSSHGFLVKADAIERP